LPRPGYKSITLKNELIELIQEKAEKKKLTAPKYLEDLIEKEKKEDPT